MESRLASVLRPFLKINFEEITLARREFLIPAEDVRIRLERVGETFLFGYHAALSNSAPEGLAGVFEKVDLDFRGFAYEGAAMALDLLDQLMPWSSSRVTRFLAGPAESHTYMVMVGIGWCMARLRFRWEHRMSKLDPLLRWLAIDGWGFHEGYFHWRRYVGGKPQPRELKGYARRAFDQGLGRSFWFIAGADPDLIAELVKGFPDSRRGDLWSGVALACTYTGFEDSVSPMLLRETAGAWGPHLAQGAAFAAKARERAGNPTDSTDNACRLFTGHTAREAAAICDRMLNYAADGNEPAYESWRMHIREYFSDRRTS